MEEEMEVELPVFEARVIDIDYEFDAARFFDFTREAEFWFEWAPSYPPSPFVAKLFLKEYVLLENVNTSPKSEVTPSLENDSDNDVGSEFSLINVEDRGLTFNDHISLDKVKAGAKSAKKSLPRSSTLMKPTRSQLAKQNWLAQVGNSRFQTQLVQNGERSFCNSSVVETQATKRQ